MTAEKTSKYEIAANIALKGIEGQWVRMSAQEQREVFGAFIFGKLQIRVDLNGQGKVEARKRAGCSFTGDMLWNEWTLDQVAAAASTGRKLEVN